MKVYDVEDVEDLNLRDLRIVVKLLVDQFNLRVCRDINNKELFLQSYGQGEESDE